MLFTKVGPDKYTSPSGRSFNSAQVRLWHANGDKFPGQKTDHYAGGGTVKGYMGKEQCFAQGGEVLGRTKDFMKTPDRFREGRFTPKPEPTEDVWGKGDSAANPAGKDKSLKAIKPRT